MSLEALAENTQTTPSPESLMLPCEALNIAFVLPDNSNEKKEAQEYRAHCFFLEDMALLLDTDRMRAEIFDELQICRLPHTQPWLYGMANKRGTIVPIFDLYQYLDIKTFKDIKRHHKYLLVETENGTVGLLVDSLPIRVVVSEENKIEPPALPQKLRAFVQGCFVYKEFSMISWDICGFFQQVGEEAAL